MKTMTPEDFATMKEFFEKTNPGLARDPEAMARKMAEYDRQIDSYLADKPPGFEAAVKIALQSRNFLAIYVGSDERPMPKEIEHLLERDRRKKHVAIFIDSMDAAVAKAVTTALEMYPGLNFKSYGEAEDLIKSLIAGNISGIIAVHTESNYPIENHLRHCLKFMPGFSRGAAEKYQLPNSVDFFPPHQCIVDDILRTINEMQEGIYSPAETAAPATGQTLSSFKTVMYPRPDQTVVTVIDDSPSEIEPIAKILKIWPNVKVNIIYQTDDSFPQIPADTQILLTDEKMPGITGSQIVQTLRHQGFIGIAASIWQNEKPEWAEHHFALKKLLLKDDEATALFVKFINVLLMKLP